MDSHEQRKEQSLAELRGSEAWRWLQDELVNWLDTEFEHFEDGFEDHGECEFHRGRAAAIKEIANITED